MTETFQCGDPGALVAFLYDECEPGERDQIAAHIKQCVSCASEIDALGATRQSLAAWRPPDIALGFQITRAHDPVPANVLVPNVAWWRAPLPAWAQAAAAVVIFAAGVSIGVGRTPSSVQTAALDAGVTPSATTPPASATTATNVSRDELAQLEQRLRSEISQMRTVSSPVAPAPAGSSDALMSQVKALIEQGNAEQNRDFTLRLVDLASDFDIRNRRVVESVGQLQGAVRTEFGQQRQVNEQFRGLLTNVSERSR